MPNQYKTVLVLTTLITLWAIWVFLRKNLETEKWLILAGFLAPFGGALLFLILAKLQGNESSVYLVRYFIFCSSFYLMILAVYLNKFKIKQIGTLLAIILIGLNLYSIWYYWNELNVNERKGMAAASEFLASNVEPNHKLYVGTTFEFFNYKYYNRTPVKPLLFTGGQYVHNLPHYAGTAILTDEDLILDFNSGVKSGDIVWLIWTNGFGGTKPNTPANWTQIDEKGFAEIRPYVGTWIIVTEYKVN